jgi:HSP20 family protein
MSNMTRFNPFNELARTDPFGDDFFKGFTLRPVYGSAESAPQMRLDIAEDDKAYKVKAEIPGVTKDEIHVSVDGNMVSIRAEVKKDTEEKDGEKVIRSERYYGNVSRSFTLSQDVDENGAAAKYNEGVLELTLPKKAGSSARQVKVS